MDIRQQLLREFSEVRAGACCGGSEGCTGEKAGARYVTRGQARERQQVGAAAERVCQQAKLAEGFQGPLDEAPCVPIALWIGMWKARSGNLPIMPID